MTTEKQNLLIVTEAALENPYANPLSAADRERVNGVVRTYQNLTPHLESQFHVHFLTPFDYPGEEQNAVKALFKKNTPFSIAAQKSIRLVWPSTDDLDQRMTTIRPDHVHIATEGPLGLKTMLYCKARDIPISTAFHTNWQQYLMEDDADVPLIPREFAAWGAKKLLVKFHQAARATMAATPELKDELSSWGLKAQNIHIVSRGIDTNTFKPHPHSDSKDYIVCVGRVAPGKGVERFCALDTGAYKKVVVGEGPLLAKLKTQFPSVEFTGFSQGEKLAHYYSGAKLFVLPSDTETFGMTVIESLACGTPVVALNRGGHQPIINDRGGLGVMDGDLQVAFNEAIADPLQFLHPVEMAAYIKERRSWEREARNFSTMVAAARKQTKSSPG